MMKKPPPMSAMTIAAACRLWADYVAAQAPLDLSQEQALEKLGELKDQDLLRLWICTRAIGFQLTMMGPLFDLACIHRFGGLPIPSFEHNPPGMI